MYLHEYYNKIPLFQWNIEYNFGGKSNPRYALQDQRLKYALYCWNHTTIKERNNILTCSEIETSNLYFTNYPLESWIIYYEFQGRDHAKCRAKSPFKPSRAFYTISVPFPQRRKDSIIPGQNRTNRYLLCRDNDPTVGADSVPSFIENKLLFLRDNVLKVPSIVPR